METYFWTLFWILLAAGVAVTAAVLPYGDMLITRNAELSS